MGNSPEVAGKHYIQTVDKDAGTEFFALRRKAPESAKNILDFAA
jgi:hypothetical protein